MTHDTLTAALGNHPWSDRILVLDTVDSTNTFAKTLAAQGAPHGTVVLSNHQTGGRGRRGRSFASPKGMGIYLSVILRFDAAPDQLLHTTCVAAEAMRRAVLDVCGLETGIKWINDLVYDRKKLCGILTELTVTPAGKPDSLICGIGLNCLQMPEDFPPEVAAIATSLRQITGHADRTAMAAAMIRQLHLASEDLLANPAPWMADYKTHCITLGQDVQLLRGDEIRYAHVDDMDDQGALLVTLTDGTKETVFSGEASVRGMYGYI